MHDSCFKVYSEILNVLELIISNCYWYCFCDKIRGCEINYKQGTGCFFVSDWTKLWHQMTRRN